MDYLASFGLLLILVFLAIRVSQWRSYLLWFSIVLTILISIYFIYKKSGLFESNSIVFVGAFIAFLFSILLIVWLSLAERTRSQLKVKLAKAFSLYKYDYRESWLGFNSALDYANQEQEFYPKSIKALAEIVSSPGGKLWVKTAGRFAFIDHWNSPLRRDQSFSLPSELIAFVEKNNWVVDVNEYRKDPSIYKHLKLDVEKLDSSAIKIFVPLRRENELIGIVGLKSLDDTQKLNWEDHDLLKAAGQQLASYLGLYEATSRLYEQREFAAFNRLSTFVVHDLKNVSAQLELITQNSSKFGTNPEFIRDSYETVASANNRISKMLKQLRRKEDSQLKLAKTYIPNLVELVKENVPDFQIAEEVPKAYVMGAEDQLLNVILHIEDNAKQAIDQKTEVMDTNISRSLEIHNNDLYWHIIDRGIGMSEEFMRDKLFKPFETTKGNAGMGIGVYQCRYLLRSNDGDLIIRSKKGKGTHCTIILALLSEQDSMNSNRG